MITPLLRDLLINAGDGAKRVWELQVMHDTKKVVNLRQNRADIHMNSETVTAGTNLHTLRADKIQARIKSRQKISLQLKKYWQLTDARGWKITFLQWSDIGYINHTPGKAPYLREVGKLKLDSMFSSVSKEEERGVGRTERWRGSMEELEEDKKCDWIRYLKSLKIK